VQITRPDEKTVLLSRLDRLLSDLLRRVPESANPGDNAAARERLFSPPTHDRKEKDMLSDWRDYVEPELAKLFLSSIEVIERDLKKLRVDKVTGEAALSLPASHLEAWIHGLNQARLALAARHNFAEQDMERSLPLGGDPRALALLQVRFYGIVQELFLRELDGSD
jgi:hypothetical protein